MTKQQQTTTAAGRVNGIPRGSDMHEARRRKAQEIEEKLAKIRTARERISVALLVAGGVALALVGLLAIRLLRVLA